jgi:hypothetical protein
MSFDNYGTWIEGYIGHDESELKTDKKGKQYVRFSVCVTTNKNASLWFQVSVYGEKAKYLVEKERIKKGLDCYARGKMTVSTYFDKKTNSWKPSVAIFADSVFIQQRLITKKQEKDLEAANKIDEEISDEVVEDLEAAPF